MSSSNIIVLYDIPGNCSKDHVWSPNTIKIRYVLNHKKLPYRVEWVEFPDIAAVAQKVGAPPSGMGRRGPIFSIPFIYDPATSKYVSNTIDIARHLDAAYPNTPPVFPIGSEPLIAAFDDLWHEKGVPPMFPLMIPFVYKQLNPASQPYFRKTREAFMKKPLEELCKPTNEPALLVEFEKALSRFDSYMGDHSPFVMGTALTYADASMAGWLTWMKRVRGPESQAWKAVEAWQGGRWKRFMDAFATLEYFPEGGLTTKL